MRPQLDANIVIKKAEDLLKTRLQLVEVANQGADNLVIKVTYGSGNNLIIKIGPDAATDFFVLKLLEKISVKVPKAIDQGKLNIHSEEFSLVITSCYEGSLLKDIPDDQKVGLVEPIIEEFKKVHQIKSPGKAGYIIRVHNGEDWEWNKFLLRNFNGENEEFNWEKDLDNKIVNKKLVRDAIEVIKNQLRELQYNSDFALLHTDINQSNIFIRNGQVEGIIDWSDCVYGDPLYDFARYRMNIEQRKAKDELNKYYETLKMSAEEQKKEKLYYLIHITEYVSRYLFYQVPHMVLRQQELIEEALRVQ